MKSIFLLALVVCVANAKVANLKAFSWDTTCGAEAPILVTALSVSPDPVVLPGDVTISLTVEASEDMVDGPGNNLTIAIQKQDDSGEYVDFPCVDLLNLGSCSYDLCPTLDSRFVDPECPAELTAHNIPCHCSQMVAGTYDITPITLTFPIGVLGELVDGTYHVHLTLVNNGRTLTCLDFYLDLLVTEA